MRRFDSLACPLAPRRLQQLVQSDIASLGLLPTVIIYIIEVVGHTVTDDIDRPDALY